MTRTVIFLLTAAAVLGAAFAIPHRAHAQPGYGQQGGSLAPPTTDAETGATSVARVTFSSSVKSAAPPASATAAGASTTAASGSTTAVAPTSPSARRPPGPPPPQTINCSSNDGRRNWCAIGNARDVQLVRQISGSPCVRGSTWGIDNRGLWVDNGCRADFAFGGGGYRPTSTPPPPQIITCSSNNGKRNWCDVGGSRDIRFNRQISGSACIEGQTWGIDNRGLWVDRGCRAEFRVRY